MRNKIIERREALEAALLTVRYQIANLQKYFSKEQVRCWRIRRDSIIKQLRNLPTVAQVKQDAKNLTALKKQILKPIPKRNEIRKMQ